MDGNCFMDPEGHVYTPVQHSLPRSFLLNKHDADVNTTEDRLYQWLKMAPALALIRATVRCMPLHRIPQVRCN